MLASGSVLHVIHARMRARDLSAHMCNIQHALKALAACLHEMELCRQVHTKRTESAVWDDLAFQRVFLTESDALLWWQRHRGLGTPAQPFHYTPYIARCREQAARVMSANADFVTGARCMTQAAVASGELQAAAELGRCVQQACSLVS